MPAAARLVAGFKARVVLLGAISQAKLAKMFPSNDIYANIVTPNSKQEEFSLPFFHFPSPYSLHELGEILDDHDLFLHQHHDDLLFHPPLMRSSEDSVSETVINMPDSDKINESMIDCGAARSGNVINKKVPRKRSNKGDRHSKINTAQGPRDRRMRLSLEVARRFFGLQDILGYDKASKTVEWLLLQAKPEIEKLLTYGVSCRTNPNSYSTSIPSSSTSECEVVSGSISKGKPSRKNKKISRQTRNVSLRPLARDLRKKARARAKARTEEKKQQWSEKLYQSKLEKNDMNRLSCWRSFETGGKSCTLSHKMNPSLMEVVTDEVEEPRSNGRQHLGVQGDMVDETLSIMCPNTIFTCLQNSGIPQEQQLTDFHGVWQIMGGLQP
ncbi:hypothetical protein SLA2020_481700 [Shorea laevis]